MSEDLIHTAGSGETDAPEAAAPPASPPGYELSDEIGRGGMGIVYRARDIALDRDVAVKLLANRYPADSPAAQRFLSEARITGQLQHPGIPAVHQVGALADGRPFLAMKLIKGSTLEAILKHRPDSAAERGRLLAVAAAAVLAAAVVGGLTVVLAVQRQANADLAAKNRELADEQAKVQERFELALKAIALFRSGVSEDMLLKNAELKELRTNKARGIKILWPFAGSDAHSGVVSLRSTQLHSAVSAKTGCGACFRSHLFRLSFWISWQMSSNQS